MKIITLLLNILCLKFCLSISNPNNLQMIVDVIASYEVPTSVVAKVCWQTVYKTKLAKILAKETRITIRYARGRETIHNTKKENHWFFLIDVNCPEFGHFLDQADTKKMLGKPYRWLVVGKSDAVMDKLEEFNILVDSEFIVAKEERNGEFILHAVFKRNPKTTLTVENYGTWTSSSGLNKSDERMVSNVMRRKDLKGYSIATSAIITDNRTRDNYDDLSNTIIDPLTKSTCQTLKNLYNFLNASMVITFSDTWGYAVNGTWNGMTGDLHSGKAELSGTFLFVTEERLPIVQYLSVPASTSSARIVFRQPPLSYQFNLFVLPFTTGVWYSLCVYFLILIIIVYVHAKWDIKKYEDYKEKNINETYLKGAWSDVILFVISAIFQQGSSNELKGTLGRLVMFIVFLAFVFFYTSYSANIVVLLQSTSSHIRTISDLTNSKLEVGLEDTVYNKFYFSTASYINYLVNFQPKFAQDPVRKALYETKIGSKPNYMSLEDGVKKLQTMPFAFHMNTGSGYKIVSQYFQEHEKCGLREIDFIRATKPWLCSKKDSPYAEMYRVGLLRVEEHGLSDRNNRLIFSKKPSCTVSGNFGSVNMMDFYPVLLILLYGMILAFVLLFLEILVHRRQKLKANLITDN